MDTEHHVVAAAIAGDREAFSQLVHRHRPAIHCLTQRLTEGHAEAEDPVQETRGLELENVRGHHTRHDPETMMLLRQTIELALSSLSADARLIIVLRDVDGLDYREIADLTGVPIGTVESRLFRARRKLRHLLQPVDGEYDDALLNV